MKPFQGKQIQAHQLLNYQTKLQNLNHLKNLI